MPNDLKGDLINGAYSQMRISGITVNPSSGDISLALRRLENMAVEFHGRNICTGYNFEDDPDVNTPSGLDRKFWHAFECTLAGRLLSDFGKGQAPDPMLLKNASGQLSFLYAATANPRETQYPRRQAIGAGNSLRYHRYRRFYTPTEEAPNTCATNQMIVGDIDNFVEHFDSYLDSGEDIASHTIEADTGLTIVSDSLTTPDVDYQIQAVGNDGISSDSLLQVKIVATTSTGRVTTRVINFELTTSPEIA